MVATSLLLPSEQKQLDRQHLQEWLDSGVDESIVRLNVESLYGNAAIEAVAGNLLASLGSHSTQYTTQQTKRILDRYAFLADGMWLVTGVDPLNNFEPLEFGQGKPDSPRVNPDTKKIHKYELRPKSEARAIYLRVNWRYGFKIAKRYGLEQEYQERYQIAKPLDSDLDAEDLGFWRWVQDHPEIYIIICEGAKKAGCLISLGFAAVSLPGIRMGYRKDPEPRLVNDLKVFAQPDRTFIFGFDQDEKPKTRNDVANAEWATARLLQAEECFTLTAQWEVESGKGIDDVWANKGADRVIEILENAAPLNRKRMPEGFDPTNREYVARRRRFRFRQFWDILKQDFTMSVGGSITQEYQGYCPTLDLTTARTIFVNGWLGAGKSESMIRTLCEHAKRKLVIVVVPRNGLGRDLVRRLRAKGVYASLYQDDVALHRDLLRTGEPGVIVMCPDSFKDYAVSNINWENTLLVIDEFNGVRGELPTKPREFPQVEEALRRAEKVIVLDAFLSNIDVGIVSQYRSGTTKIYKQQFFKSPKPITWLECRTKTGDLAFVHDGIYVPFLTKMVKDSSKTFAVATDSKKQAKALKRLLERLGRKPLLVCADTPSDSGKFMADADGQWNDPENDWDCLIYTPTAQSGLDIQSYFDWGLLICNGIIPPVQMIQMLGRCRQADRWYVSAPRRAIESDTPTTKLSPVKLKDQAERLTVLMQQKAWQHSNSSAMWQVWQNTVSDIYKQFNSECTWELLNHFFETVSVEFVEETDTSGYRDLVAQVGRDDADRTLLADLTLGQELAEKKASPQNDREVWAYKLAQTVEQYPLTESFAEQYKTTEPGEEKEEILQVFQLFTSNRLNRIKRWVMAHDPKCLEELEESLNSGFVTLNCRLLRTYLNIRLFRDLRLDRLAMCSRKQKPVVDETHFSVHSPIVAELWDKFQQSDLPELLFGVETMQDLWNLVRRCMSAMGFQSVGKSIRVKSEDLHKNGRHRNGEARESKSVSLYFSAWLRMDESGSEKFREMFPTIVKAIEEMIQRDRDKREQRKLAGLSLGDVEDDPIPRVIEAMQTCESWEEYKRRVPDRATAQRAWDYLKSYPEGKRLAFKLQDKLKQLRSEARVA